MSKKLAIGVLLAVTLSGCPGPAPPPTATQTPEAVSSPAENATPVATPSKSASQEASFLIVAGERMGAIDKSSTEASLKEAFGPENVTSESIYVGEGMELPGLAIFAAQPEKRVEIVWDQEDATRIMLVRVEGETSEWKTAEGVSLGTDLVTLEKLNGKSFELTGLEWDLGGWVSNWNGGKLEGLNLRLGGSSNDQLSEEESMAIVGDKQVKSDHPAMLKANPKAIQISVNFPPDVE